MDWRNVPVGMIRNDELLNALLAIWKLQYNNASRDSSEFSQGYLTGFEEGLNAIAQVAGLIEGFESGKSVHCSKIRAKLTSKMEFIEGQAAVVDAY